MPDRLGDLVTMRPENFGVANAVGAAIAQISGEVDRVFSLGRMSREDALASANADLLTAVIQIYKALGGGWQSTEA